MKKSNYILIIVFLIYGNGFANSADLLNVFGVNSIGNELSSFDTSDPIKDALIVTKISVNNDLCEIRSRSCFDNAYLIHTESKKHTHCAKLFYSYQEMKTFGMETIYDTPIDSYEVSKTTNYMTYVVSGPEYLSPINSKFKRLQNLNLENYMSQPINPSYTRGFGIRLGL
jgi:hypothetical protein